jgi:cytochrome c biogenesis protein CcmG, thiol:disulfide interchange protein DsbE
VTGGRLAWAAAAMGAAVLVTALAWGLVHPASKPADAVLGKVAPNLVVQSIGGTPASLAALKGRPVVLNFWASWCAPCQQESQALKDSAQSLGEQVAFLGVDFKDAPEAARAYQDRNRLPYPTGPAVAGIPSQYGLVQPPLTYFIDREGVAVARFDGPLTAPLISRYLQLAGVGR